MEFKSTAGGYVHMRIWLYVHRSLCPNKVENIR